MKSKIVETGKHTIIYGISSAFQSLIGFVLLPLLTKFYSAEEFGVYSLLILISTLAGAFFFFGSSSTLNRYFFESDTEEHKKSIVSTTFLITLIGALLQIIFGFIFSNKLSILLTGSGDFSNHVFLILLASAIGMLMNFNFVVIRLEKKSKVFVQLNIFSNLLNLGLVYYLLVFRYAGIYAPIIGLLIGNLVAFVISYFHVKKYFGEYINKIMIREYLFFGLSTTINGITYYFLDWIDRYFVKQYASLADVGIYSMGYKIGMIIHVIMIIPFSMIWSTVRMQYAKDEDNTKFVSKVFSYYTIIGLFIVLSTSIFAKELLFIFSGREEYYIAYKVVPIIMIAHLIYGYINIVDFGIIISKKLYFFYLTFIVASGLNAFLNYIFVPKYGYIAAAYITLLTYLFCSSVIYLIGRKYYRLTIDWKRVISPFILVALILYISENIAFSLIVNIAIKITVIGLVGVLIYSLWLTKSEKLIARNIPVKIKQYLGIS